MTLLRSRAIRIANASLVAGILVGVVGGAFRYLLVLGENQRNNLVSWAHHWPWIGWTFPILLGVFGAGLARMLVIRFAPTAAGSGVQRVEAVIDGQVKPAGPAIVPVKFIGGLLAIGSGLALGREGPTVQMGSSLATLVSQWMIHAEEDKKIVEAAGAGAGLAVAFNAPIGGSVFVFEELTSNFTQWLLVATLAGASVAVWLMRVILGNKLDFMVAPVGIEHTWRLAPFLLLVVLLGCLGVLYNQLTLLLQRVSENDIRLTSVYRAAIIGGIVGLIAWFSPILVGGGDSLTQAILSERFELGGLATVFVLRFLIGPWSYAAATPGGLFAPILVLGASFGALFAGVANHLWPGLGLTPVSCAVVGMGALFSACIRAPLTGIVLAVEMTGRADLTLGLIVAALGAMVMAMLLRNEPIYQSLKHRMLQQEVKAAQMRHGQSRWELRPVIKALTP